MVTIISLYFIHHKSYLPVRQFYFVYQTKWKYYWTWNHVVISCSWYKLTVFTICLLNKLSYNNLRSINAIVSGLGLNTLSLRSRQCFAALVSSAGTQWPYLQCRGINFKISNYLNLNVFAILIIINSYVFKCLYYLYLYTRKTQTVLRCRYSRKFVLILLTLKILAITS